MLADKLPEVLDFSKDLAHLEPASKVLSVTIHEVGNLRSACPFLKEVLLALVPTFTTGKKMFEL